MHLDRFELASICFILKKHLKMQKITYSQLSISLEMSESSIKRLLNGDDIKFSQLLEICDILKISFFDVVRAANKPSQKYFELSIAQQNFFLANLKYYAFYSLLLSEVAIEDILSQILISKEEGFRYLRQLEKIGLIKFNENGSVSPTTTGSLNLSHGPLADYLYMKERTHTILETKKNYINIGKQQVCSNHGIGFLTQKSLRYFVDEVRKLFNSISDYSQFESKFHPREELINCAWLASVTPQENSFVNILHNFPENSHDENL
ncbi:helix-turn-helix transcriptional regulator [Dolichospermum sp. ST_sed1]|nr:helix-turn-helix transcriptional regulator [Dolichospermum sp. ST_sed1]